MAGPLEIFVSRHNIPDDTEFDFNSSDCWVCSDGDIQIREGSIVRLKILGLTINDSSMVISNSISKACFYCYMLMISIMSYRPQLGQLKTII